MRCRKRWDERRHSAEAEALCWLLRYWVEFIHDSIREHRPDIPESLTNRDTDKWEPLFMMADLAGGRWPELARVTAVTAVTASEANEPSEGMRLLWAIQAIFGRLKVAHISSAELVAELDKTGEFAWSRWPAQRAGIRMANILKAVRNPSQFLPRRHEDVLGIRARLLRQRLAAVPATKR